MSPAALSPSGRSRHARYLSLTPSIAVVHADSLAAAWWRLPRCSKWPAVAAALSASAPAAASFRRTTRERVLPPRTTNCFSLGSADCLHSFCLNNVSAWFYIGNAGAEGQITLAGSTASPAKTVRASDLGCSLWVRFASRSVCGCGPRLMCCVCVSFVCTDGGQL